MQHYSGVVLWVRGGTDKAAARTPACPFTGARAKDGAWPLRGGTKQHGGSVSMLPCAPYAQAPPAGVRLLTSPWLSHLLHDHRSSYGLSCGNDVRQSGLAQVYDPPPASTLITQAVLHSRALVAPHRAPPHAVCWPCVLTLYCL